MLIFDSKKGRFGTQKPKQWGALSAVRSAVFRNAESMGIDPQNVKICLPFWEGAGQAHNYGTINKNSDLINGASWTNTGAAALTSLDMVNTGIPIESIGWSEDNGTQITVSFDYKKTIDGPADGYYLFASSGSFTPFSFKILNDFSSCRLYFTSTYLTAAGTALLLSDGYPHNISIAAKYASSFLGVYVDGILTDSWTTQEPAGAISEAFTLFGNSTAGYSSGGEHTYANVFYDLLSGQQIAQLAESPYFLLQPNPTPLIFDWGTASTVPTLSAPSFVGRIPSTTLAF
jgi:hypothetical protein